MPRSRKIGPEEEQKIREMYELGYTAIAIGGLLGVNPATVRTSLRRMGVRVLRGPRVDQEKILQIATLRAKGLSARNISRELDLPRSRVSTILAEAENEVIKTHFNIQLEEVRILRQEGHKIGAIAKKMDIPFRRVLYLMECAGIKKDPHSRRTGVSAEQVGSIVQEYKSGVSTKILGQRYGVDDTTIARYLRSYGVPIRPKGFRFGPEHHAWAGGRYEHPDGYIYLWVTSADPLFSMVHKRDTTAGGYVYEHRLVMARHLGRPLTDHETVHHIDGDKKNNHIDNLQLRQGRHGKGSALRCADCGSCNIIGVPIADPLPQ